MCSCYVRCNARCSCYCHGPVYDYSDEREVDVNVYPGLTVTQIVDLTMWELELSDTP